MEPQHAERADRGDEADRAGRGERSDPPRVASAAAQSGPDENGRGLLTHLEAHLGPLREAARPGGADDRRPYDLAAYDFEPKGMPVTTVVTNGLRFRRITTPKPQEVLCSLWSGHAEIAAYLVETTAEHIVRTGQGVAFGTVVANDRPIVPGTGIVGVLGCTGHWFGADFALHTDESGDVLTQLVTLLPVTRPEADFVAERGHDGMDALWERFREHRVNVFDVRRPSAVPVADDRGPAS